ncbi:MAG: TIR domain-containing protein [Haliscomenobacteraceae bacterium CHB4]|nr:TIR domain-containing protein [Haliscomenobacteraceae bacterium CHB4]
MLYKYRAFISYRHSENGRHHAVALETALKRYAKPTFARPMSIFRDEKHMRPDISLPKLIREGLENSEYLILLAERASAESQWCGEELEYWCGALQRTDRLIIVLVDDDIALNGTDGVHWEQTTALPGLLQPYLISIPLYVDLRWAKRPTDTDLQNPKYRQEVNALAARLRGVNPEDLNDEEIRVFRRNIRLRNGAIGVLLGMLVVSVGATFWALNAQKEAQRQQQIAVSNAAEAKKQQQIAEKNLADRIEQETQKERLNFDKYVSSGDVFANSGDFPIALRYYQKADSVLQKFPNDAQLQSKREVFAQKLNHALIKIRAKR